MVASEVKSIGPLFRQLIALSCILPVAAFSQGCHRTGPRPNDMALWAVMGRCRVAALGIRRHSAYRSSVNAIKDDGCYRLLPPATPDEWETYHRIRREVLLEAR